MNGDPKNRTRRKHRSAGYSVADLDQAFAAMSMSFGEKTRLATRSSDSSSSGSRNAGVELGPKQSSSSGASSPRAQAPSAPPDRVILYKVKPKVQSQRLPSDMADESGARVKNGTDVKSDARIEHLYVTESALDTPEHFDHVIIGAGIAGIEIFNTIRSLYPEDSVCIVDSAPGIMTKSTMAQPGRLHNGFHFRDLETSKFRLRMISQLPPHYRQHVRPEEYVYYVVPEDTETSFAAISRHYEQLAAYYKELTKQNADGKPLPEGQTNEFLGDPDDFFKPIINAAEVPEAIQSQVRGKRVKGVYRVREEIMNWRPFKESFQAQLKAAEEENELTAVFGARVEEVVPDGTGNYRVVYSSPSTKTGDSSEPEPKQTHNIIAATRVHLATGYDNDAILEKSGLLEPTQRSMIAEILIKWGFVDKHGFIEPVELDKTYDLDDGINDAIARMQDAFAMFAEANNPSSATISEEDQIKRALLSNGFISRSSEEDDIRAKLYAFKIIFSRFYTLISAYDAKTAKQAAKTKRLKLIAHVKVPRKGRNIADMPSAMTVFPTDGSAITIQKADNDFVWYAVSSEAIGLTNQHQTTARVLPEAIRAWLPDGRPQEDAELLNIGRAICAAASLRFPVLAEEDVEVCSVQTGIVLNNGTVDLNSATSPHHQRQDLDVRATTVGITATAPHKMNDAATSAQIAIRTAAEDTTIITGLRAALKKVFADLKLRTGINQERIRGALVTVFLMLINEQRQTTLNLRAPVKPSANRDLKTTLPRPQAHDVNIDTSAAEVADIKPTFSNAVTLGISRKHTQTDELRQVALAPETRFDALSCVDIMRTFNAIDREEAKDTYHRLDLSTETTRLAAMDDAKYTKTKRAVDAIASDSRSKPMEGSDAKRLASIREKYWQQYATTAKSEKGSGIRANGIDETSNIQPSRIATNQGRKRTKSL